ncbi:hypothetical protein Glove_586g30 [Diversispora epigaea]|uniref:Uncharacterized protein n=1 Tax=Diversispora epigaea TaxID=1348612 RepID=A0A397GE78_9GLOM|nr:hypothetical protein Glove_586g30 [Diversispora epigaea]
MWVYKRDQREFVFCRERTLGDINGGDILSGFTLDVEMIEDTILQKSTPTETSEKLESRINKHFTDDHSFMKNLIYVSKKVRIQWNGYCDYIIALSYLASIKDVILS